MSKDNQVTQAVSGSMRVAGSTHGLKLQPASRPVTEEDRLVTVAEAAIILGCHDKTVRKMINYRILAAVRIGVGDKRAPFRISMRAIQQYIASRTTRTL